MVGRILLTAAIILVTSSMPANASEKDDEKAGGLFGSIVSDQGGGHVDLEATYESKTPPAAGAPETDTNPSDHGPEDDTPSTSPSLPDGCTATSTGFIVCTADAAAAPGEPAAPVTLRDIASFRPATPGNEMEPGGWAMVGLPANFVAAASAEVVSGTLLGQPADVRFTPVGYRWTHSDGAIVESATPGASWAALSQREFTETPTSHVYAAAGEYTVDLAVVLRAEYRFAGSGWRSIAGTLTVAGEPQRVLVGEFDTVLTQGDCNANPSGPGC